MSLLSRLNNMLPEVKGTQNTQGLTMRQQPLPAFIPDDAKWIGNEVTLYASKDGESYINSGFNINSVVHTCLDKIMKVFGKVPFYVVEINPNEKKAFQEGQRLAKMIHDPRARAEVKRINKKSIDGIIQDNALAKFLNKPNRNDSGVDFRELAIGYKKLTGEAPQWFNRGKNKDGSLSTDGKALEMFVLPKYTLQLVGNGIDPWEIIRWQLSLGGAGTLSIPKENLLMWKEKNFNFNAATLEHLRGQPPLEAVLLNIQALNESAIREIKEAVNGGANGLLYRKDAKDLPTDPSKISNIRGQINNAINGQDAAGMVAWLAGEWGYIPFGFSSKELQRIELTEANADKICNVLGVPPGLLKSNQTYTNAPTYWKQLIYGVIAPEAYSLRDAWNTTLPEMFGMDPERYQIDCDVLALPELAEDLKDQVAAVKDANWLSKNEKRIATGYEPTDNPNHDIVPEDETFDLGSPLDKEEEEFEK